MCGGTGDRLAGQSTTAATSCFPDESYPPALFKKVSQLLVDRNVGIKWTTLIRFEETLRDQAIWDRRRPVAARCTTVWSRRTARP